MLKSTHKNKLSRNNKHNTFFSDFLRIVGKHLLKHQPIFDLSDINEVSEECRTHSKIFVESLENLNYWAMESK